mmetsp:Transcript_26444/g.57951  ORF Transcript_26444/g.57951 Transcript_26444/m.57951 type:complete len:395 (-) Transcript_26444:393-1577(-)
MVPKNLSAVMSRSLVSKLAWHSHRRLCSTSVRAGHELDLSKATPILIECGALPQGTERIQVEQFSHGQSNPTYLLKAGDQVKLVLRKQPPGKLLRGAHAVDREYRAMTALKRHTDVPVPTTRIYVDDPGVIGTPFFVYDYVPGRFFKDASMRKAESAQDRAALWASVLQTICRIHTVDYVEAGLSDFGKVGGYLPRQTKVWTAQYRAAETERIEAMEKLIAWLPEALPTDDITTLVHGDLRVDNMIFSANGSAVDAVLDWELATLGHPASDLALATMPYDTPVSLPSALGGFSKEALENGVPDEFALVDEYVQRTGLESVRQHLDYHRAFVCFRMASILQGVYKRSMQGQASAADGAAVGKLAGAVAELGNKCAARYTSNPDRLFKAASAGAAP